MEVEGETVGDSTGGGEVVELGATEDATGDGEVGVVSEEETGKRKDRGTEGEGDSVEEGGA